MSSLAAPWLLPALATACVAAVLLPDGRAPVQLRASCDYPGSQNGGVGSHNNYSCASALHPNPVVLLHGLGATYYEDINYLEVFLQQKGYCTFSLTYGAYDAFPYVGGLEPIATSAQEIADFMRQVQSKTAAAKLDIVAHSEGAFQSLYVPKFEGVGPIVDKIVAIAPPTHGTTFGGLYDFSYLGGNLTSELTAVILDTVGCAACADLGPSGGAVARLNDGTPIRQPGNQLTVIASRSDQLVTPIWTAFVNETGVHNTYVQDSCPKDRVGHIGEAYDTNVWNLVLNALDPTHASSFVCSSGCPY